MWDQDSVRASIPDSTRPQLATDLAARVVVRIEELAGLELGGVEGTLVISIAASPAAATGSASRPSSCPAAGRAGD